MSHSRLNKTRKNYLTVNNWKAGKNIYKTNVFRLNNKQFMTMFLCKRSTNEEVTLIVLLPGGTFQTTVLRVGSKQTHRVPLRRQRLDVKAVGSCLARFWRRDTHTGRSGCGISSRNIPRGFHEFLLNNELYRHREKLLETKQKANERL